MSDLRKKVIKLAHSQPSLRKYLVPLLKEAAVWMEDIPETYYKNFRPRGSSKMGVKAAMEAIKVMADRFSYLAEIGHLGPDELANQGDIKKASNLVAAWGTYVKKLKPSKGGNYDSPFYYLGNFRFPNDLAGKAAKAACTVLANYFADQAEVGWYTNEEMINWGDVWDASDVLASWQNYLYAQVPPEFRQASTRKVGIGMFDEPEDYVEPLASQIDSAAKRALDQISKYVGGLSVDGSWSSGAHSYSYSAFFKKVKDWDGQIELPHSDNIRLQIHARPVDKDDPDSEVRYSLGISTYLWETLGRGGSGKFMDKIQYQNLDNKGVVSVLGKLPAEVQKAWDSEVAASGIGKENEKRLVATMEDSAKLLQRVLNKNKGIGDPDWTVHLEGRTIPVGDTTDRQWKGTMYIVGPNPDNKNDGPKCRRAVMALVKKTPGLEVDGRAGFSRNFWKGMSWYIPLKLA